MKIWGHVDKGATHTKASAESRALHRKLQADALRSAQVRRSLGVPSVVEVLEQREATDRALREANEPSAEALAIAQVNAHGGVIPVDEERLGELLAEEAGLIEALKNASQQDAPQLQAQLGEVRTQLADIVGLGPVRGAVVEGSSGEGSK